MSETVVSRHPQTETHPSGQRVVVFQKESKNSIVLNPTGSWIWQQLENPRSEADLLAEMVRQFPEVEEEQLRADLSSYLDELSRNGLVER